MFKLLIVEDEKWEREGLRDILDWEKLGIEITGMAYDGIDGLERSKELNPDIIITDIKMPGIDGIEMSKRIKSFLPEAKIIILTGYNDFKYAKEAISFNAYEYLLKPIEEKELLDVITRVVSKCKEECRRREEEKELITKIKYNSNIIKEKLLFDLYEGRKEKESLIKQIDNLALGIDEKSFYAIVVSKLPDYNGPQIKKKEEKSIDKVLYTDLKEYFTSKDMILRLNDENRIMFYLYVPFKGENYDLPRIKTFQRSFSEKYNNEIVIGIGEEVEDIYKIHLSCRQAAQALDYGFFWNKSEVIQYADVKNRQRKFNTGYFLKIGTTYKKRIKQSLRSSNEELLFDLLQDLFLFFGENDGIERRFIVNYLFGLINETSLVIYNILDNDINESDIKDNIVQQLSSLTSLKQMENYVVDLYKNLFQYIYERKSNKDRYIVDKVIQIIEKKYMTGLTLRTIAEEVFFSPNYLGKIFKENMGMTFNKYLNDIRMEKAKELLQSPDNNVTSVAEQIGMSNTSYFCVLFKKNYGITPGEYQELFLQK